MAKRKFIVDEKVLKEIEAAAARRLTKDEIAYVIGWSPRTFYTRQAECPAEFAEAIEKGHAKSKLALVNSLYEAATKDRNVTAAIFLLKNIDPENFNDRRNADQPLKVIDLDRYTQQEILEMAYRGLEQALRYEKENGLPLRSQQVLKEFEFEHPEKAAELMENNN